MRIPVRPKSARFALMSRGRPGMVPPRIAPVISVRVHTHVRSPYPRDDVVVFGQPCANRFVVRFGDDHGNQRGGIPIPHGRIRQILGQRFRKIHRQRQRRLVQYGRGASLARPQHPFGDQTPPDPLVVVRRGRHQSGDRRTSIEDLNLTATTHHAQIAGEIRLQVEMDAVVIVTGMVSNRGPNKSRIASRPCPRRQMVSKPVRPG